MKTLSKTVLYNGKKYSIIYWKPFKGRAYYQLFKYVDEVGAVYTMKDFPSIKKAEDYIKSLDNQ